MNELDRVLDALVKSKEELIKKEASEEERNELIASLREQRKKKIIEEIREEYKEELMQEVDMEAQKESNRQKIEELRSLMWSGFLLAFVVGLAVNQATDIIGYYKGTITVDHIEPTILLTLVLCVICIAAYLYSFCKNAVSLFDELKKDKKKSNR